jgi:hypothetical protein
MLYDVLHITEGWGPLQAVEISITLLYCIDFFYLQSDLGSDQLPQGNWRDTMLDAAIAVIFGAAYWQASDRKLFTCYALLAVVGALIVAWAILPHSVLTVLFVILAWLGRLPLCPGSRRFGMAHTSSGWRTVCYRAVNYLVERPAI